MFRQKYSSNDPKQLFALPVAGELEVEFFKHKPEIPKAENVPT